MIKLPRVLYYLSILAFLAPVNIILSQDATQENQQVSRAGMETPEFILNMAFFYYNNYDYDKAIQFFEKYLELAGEEEVALTHLGKIYLNLKQTDKARTYFERVLKLDPKNKDTLSYLADIYLTEKNNVEAIKALQTIVELDPLDERALYTLAELYNTQKDKRMTMIYYKKLSLATQKSSANIRLLNRAYTQIARYYYDNQDYEKALEYYQKIVEINPQDYSANFIYGELLKVNGNFKKSADVMEGLIRNDPANISVLESLVESLYILGDYRTRAYLNAYLENADHAKLLFNAIEKEFSGEKEEARNLFEKVLKASPNRISAHIGILHLIESQNLEEVKKEAYSIVVLSQKIKAYSLAIQYMDIVLKILEKENSQYELQKKLEVAQNISTLSDNEEKLAIEFIDAFYTHAISLDNLGSYKQAVAYYLRALNYLNTLHDFYTRDLPIDKLLHSEADLYKTDEIAFKDNAESSRLIFKLKSYQQKKYEVLINLSWVLFKHKNALQLDLIKYLAESMETDSEDPRGYFMSGIALYENAESSEKLEHSYREAQKNLKKAVDIVSEKSDKKVAPANYYFYLGITEDKLGDFIAMETNLKKAIELDPFNPLYLNYLGYMYSLKNINLEKAFEYIKRALEDDPENDAYLDTLGWIYFKMNKYEEALGQLLVARSISDKKDRKDPVIDFHIAETYNLLGNKNQAVYYYRSALENFDKSSEPLDKKYINDKINELSKTN